MANVLHREPECESARPGMAGCLPAAGEVAVWHIRTEDWQSREAALFACLDPTEKSRADRFGNPPDRVRFVVAHGVLRLILSRQYLPGTVPGALAFGVDAGGKPHLEGAQGTPVPHFNLSHSGEVALLAVASAPVGVDVERIRDTLSVTELAAVAFSPREQRELAAAPPERQRELFFQGWVRKEAWLKARGDGLSFPVQAFTVSLAPQDVRLLDVPDCPSEVERWTLAELRVGSGYRAAVALEGPVCRCRLFDARPQFP